MFIFLDTKVSIVLCTSIADRPSLDISDTNISLIRLDIRYSISSLDSLRCAMTLEPDTLSLNTFAIVMPSDLA